MTGAGGMDSCLSRNDKEEGLIGKETLPPRTQGVSNFEIPILNLPKVLLPKDKYLGFRY